MLIAALFAIAKTWQQPKHPSAKEWIKKMWYMYTMEYYSGIKIMKIMPFATTGTQPEIIILSEAQQNRVGGEMEWKVRVSRFKLLYTEWINKALQYSTANYIQYPIIKHNGKEYFIKRICKYIT